MNGNEEKSTNQKEHTVATSAFIESRVNFTNNHTSPEKVVEIVLDLRDENNKEENVQRIDPKKKRIQRIMMYEYNTVEKFDRKYKRTGEVPNPFAVSSSDEEDIKEGKKRVMGKQGDRSKAEE
ncbi:unnamed protein product [Rhizophagus irregularis]|nr:unnamed protein product [Rhizophagus irregularis]